jgi:hypothetical protein
LGSYRNSDPQWYEEATESQRWQIQARFWKAIAETVAGSPAVCWYDLINEPTAPTNPVSSYIVPFAAGGFFYVNSLTRDLAGRTPVEVAADWIAQMKTAIREVDPQTPVTVGMISSLGVPSDAVQRMLAQLPPKLLPLLSQWRGGLQTVVAHDQQNVDLDLYCLHSYPHTGEADKAIDEIRTWAASGRPVVVEETFPLHCGITEWQDYIRDADPVTAGWFSFYWGPPHDDDQNAAISLIRDLAARESHAREGDGLAAWRPASG